MKLPGFLFMALSLGACAATGGGEAPASLAGTRWIGVLEPGVDAQLAPRLEFVAGRINGFTGCNMMSGAWRMEGAEPRLSGVATTRRMCLGPGGEIEKRLLAAIGDASRVSRVGDRLVIEAPGGARFEFRKAPD